MLNNNHMKFIMSVGYSVIVFMAFIEIFSSIIFFTGNSLSNMTIWVALVGTVILLHFMSMYQKETRKRFLFNIAALVGIFIIGGLFVALFYDLSFDGQAYHQEAIYHLANKWNPNVGGPVTAIHNMWINHFAKGPWILSSVFYELTGVIESAKVFNFALLIASFLIAFGTLSRILPKQTGKAMLLSFLLALNPVVTTQLTSFYIDGQLYSLLLIIACMAYLLFKEFGVWEIIILCLSILLIINVKFLAVFYVILLLVGYLGMLMFFKRKELVERLIFPLVGSLVIAIAFIGYNPYITNVLTKGHPFYPLMGSESVDIMTPNTPPNFIYINRLEKFGHSILSKSENQVTNSELKTPLTIKDMELTAFTSPDVRVGGFGPLFGGAILLAAAIFLITLIRDPKKVKYILFPGAILLISVVLTPGAWWARYAPQLWMAPILIVIYSFVIKNKAASILSWGLIAILLANTLMVSGYHLSEQYKLSNQLEAQLDELESDHSEVQVKLGNHSSNRIRFLERDIKYQVVEELSCKDKQSFPLSETEYCR